MRQRLKKISKLLFRLVLFSFLVFFLCAILIQIPAVQKYLTGKTENYLQEKFQTTVDIESIRLRFPESLVLKGVYIEDTQQDTFLNVGELAINFKLNKLLSRSIQFDQITLKDGASNIWITKDSSNFDFILDAFGSKEEISNSTTEVDPANSNPWTLTFDDATLDLQNINFKYLDAKALDLSTQIGHLKGSIKQIDLVKMRYELGQLELKDTHIDLTLIENETDLKKSPSLDTVLFFIAADVLSMEEVSFDLKMSNLELSTKIYQLQSTATSFDLRGNDINLKIPSAKIHKTDFKYDALNAPRSGGFDYNHMDLQNITADLSDFEYDNLNIVANIKMLSGMANENFEVKKLQSNFSFTEERIVLKNLDFVSTQSVLKSKHTILRYPFLEKVIDPLSQLKIESDLIADFKSSTDLSYFYPPLDSISFFRNRKDLPLKLNANINGDFNNLNIQTFDLDGFNMKLNADGNIKNLSQQNLLNWDINLHTFKALGNEIVSYIPDGVLPEFIELPDTIAVSGTTSGNLRNFQTQLIAQTNRKDSPVPTQIKANGILKNILDTDSAYLNIQVDTFSTSKADILAYLPKDIIPDYVNLPDRFTLSGWLKGPFSKLESNLGLLTYSDNETNELKAIGSIHGLFTVQQPTFDVTLDASAISQTQLAALLPEGILPAYFELPFINKLSGFFRGDIENFNTNFELASNTGQWSVDASLKQDAYKLKLNVDEFEAQSLFTQGYLDSLTGYSVLPLNIDIRLEGQGFEFTDQASSDFKVTLKSAVDTTMKGLIIDGKLGNQVLTAGAFADEEAIKIAADFELDYTETIPEWNLNFLLDHLDLQVLQYAEVPFVLNGRFSSQVNGYALDHLNGEVLFSDWGILYDEKTAQIDSLLLLADLDTNLNQVKINSDFFNAAINGKMQFPQVTDALQQQIYNYWEVDYPDSLIGKTKDYFDFELSLFRPEILTMGFIPGLEDLSNLELEGHYDNSNGEIEMYADLPFIKWQESDFEKLALQAKGDEKKLDYQFKFEEANIQNSLNLNNFNSFGSLADNILENTSQILDHQQTKRFELKSTSTFSEDQKFQFSLAPKQILNYQKWEVSQENQINLVGDNLSISDWQLFTDQEAIEIKKLENEELELLFKQFDLNIFSDLLSPPVKSTDKLKDQATVNLDGIVNGSFTIADPKQESAITSRLKIDSLIVFDALLGNLNLYAETERGSLVEGEAVLRGNGNDLRLLGGIDLDQEFDALNFQLDIPALNLNSIEALTFGYLENMEGLAKGSVQINGSFRQPDLTGKINFENTAFDIALAKARLRLGNEAIIFDSNVIEFKDLQIFDSNGNKGIMSSYVLTDDYRDFYLQSNIKVENFQILNTTAKDNDLYFGKLFVDAIIDLNGNISEPIIDITALPTKNSDITYIYSAVSNQIESHEGVVEFIKPKEEEERRVVSKRLEAISNDFNMKVTVKIAVNESLNFTAITDPITGDYFEGKAKGDLVYVQHPDGKMELNGRLELVKGEYLFTYQKLIRRPFSVEPGGTISWTGDPFEPRMDINVLYKVKTSTYPLLASESNPGDNQVGLKQTFFVKLNIGGTLNKTEIKTSIDYPSGHGNSSDSDVSAAIDRINQDPGQQNTQAFSMILFNGFLANNLENSEFKIIDFSGNINNMITTQLNNIANRYIKFVELDFDLDTENNGANGSNTDFRVSIRKRFLNDRLTISLDGKATSETRNNESESQSYLDNVTVEYALTPDGRFKIKVYNSRGFDEFIGDTGVKLGGAFVFSKDFNGVRLFKKKK